MQYGFPALHKKSTCGKQMDWWITIKDSGRNCLITIVHGETHNISRICVNQKKAGCLSVWDYSMKLAKKKWEDKIADGYIENF